MKNFSKRVTPVVPKQDWIVVGWCIAIKILLFVVARMVVVLKIGNRPLALERS